jgi:hypothetical protein
MAQINKLKIITNDVNAISIHLILLTSSGMKATLNALAFNTLEVSLAM